MPNSPLCFGEAPGKTWLFHCLVSIGVLGRRLPEVFISLRGFGVALSSFTWKGAGRASWRCEDSDIGATRTGSIVRLAVSFQMVRLLFLRDVQHGVALPVGKRYGPCSLL